MRGKSVTRWSKLILEGLGSIPHIGEGEIRVHRINSRGYRGRRETSMRMYSVGVKKDLKLKEKLGDTCERSRLRPPPAQRQRESTETNFPENKRTCKLFGKARICA